MEALLSFDSRKETRACNCLNKCEKSVHALLIKMGLREETERSSLFNLAKALFVFNVRKGKFVLTGQAKICSYLVEIARMLRLGMKDDPDILELKDKYIIDIEELNEDVELLFEAAKSLKLIEQELLISYYLYDIPLKDYAEKKNFSYESVRMRIDRLREKMKIKIQELKSRL